MHLVLFFTTEYITFIIFYYIHENIATWDKERAFMSTIKPSAINVREFCYAMRYLLERGFSSKELDELDNLDTVTLANQLREQSGQ